MQDKNITLFQLSGLLGLYIAISFAASRFTGGLFKEKLIGVIRMVLQLILLGLSIKFIFELKSFFIQFLLMVFMTFAAVVNSRFLRAKKFSQDKAIFLSLAFSVWPIVFLGVGILDYEKLWDISFLLPIFGMVMGNSINGITLGVERFESESKSLKDHLDYYSYWKMPKKKAYTPILQGAYKSAVTPIINSMNMVGLVSIPGMMTGQILGGTDPYQSALYQIFIFFIITCSIFLGSTLGIYFSYQKQTYGYPEISEI